MADRAHIRSGQIVKLYDGERGWLSLENGDKASPIVIGYENGNDKVVAVNNVVNDTSTQSRDIVKTVDRQVNANDVTITTSIRDMTAQEIEGRKDAILADLDGDSRELLKADLLLQKQMLGYLWSQSGLNAQQFTNELETADTITIAQYKNFLRGFV